MLYKNNKTIILIITLSKIKKLKKIYKSKVIIINIRL